MKLRLMGTRSELTFFMSLLRDMEDKNIITIRSVSGFYQNRPPSIEGRVYVEID